MLRTLLSLLAISLLGSFAEVASAQGDDELTPQSEAALDRGLIWLAKNQGTEGNWGSNDLGLVSMGALAFMSAGHSPGRGKYGKEIDKALEFVVSRSKPSGLFNIADPQRDMYNHGLATFVLGQAHGMTMSKDRKFNRVLDGALQLIANTQCEDGGWDYRAKRQPNGHDLSLAVMQAKALRSAVDSGLEVPPEVTDLAIRSVREHYACKNGYNLPESEQQKLPGQFTYSKGGGGGTIAMAACGVVCLQEFGQYDDWRIPKNMEVIQAAIRELPRPRTRDGSMPFDAYTLYYVGQALYQVNGDYWKSNYPKVRDYLVDSQVTDPKNPQGDGAWRDHGARGGGRVGGRDGELYATSVSRFILAIPNRYLPILQEGKIESSLEGVWKLMFGLTFTSLAFLAAGTACAAGPIVIHLLNRRRYKVVHWAAMDFLRQAMQRNRRILQIRDIILLVLRTAAVFLFGLALARPFFASRQEEFNDRQPLHAVIVVDNSLSMGYESLEGTLLDKAKDRARQLIDKLPAGSRMSIIPACGSSEVISPDPYDTKENALEALSRIEIVDRTATLQGAANLARTAGSTSQLAKRVVFISDQQKLNWQDHQASTFEDLPMQVVDVAPADWENTWISDLRVQDGLADVETPTTIVVELRHHGPSARRDVQVTLSMGGTVIGEKSVTIEPGLGAREIDFEYVFNTLTDLPEPDKPIFVPLKATISPDRLAADDARYLAVPVVASLPVVFIDQYGPEQEDAIKGRLGETRHLRKLLAPKTSRSDAPRQLISVRHITPDELNQDVLADARLVMIAGVPSPQGMVDLLRAYVRQGGRVVIAAGANFDPAAWNDAAWLDGAGILPLPLNREPIGEVPEVAGANLKPFSLNFESLKNGGYFQLANVPESELQDLYAEPFFFKAVNVDASPEAIDRWKQAEMKRLEEELTLKASIDAQKVDQPKESVPSGVGADDRQGLEADEARLRELRPAWLSWAGTLEAELDPVLPDNPAERGRMLETLVLTKSPSVLARFDLEDRSPFLVSRKMGRGEVIFCSTGLLSSWNTLPKTNAVLIFDRILREMAQETLPRRSFEATARTTLPLPPQEQNLQATLVRPGSTAEEPLDVNNIGEDQRGVTVTGMLTRGVYRVAGYRQVLSAASVREMDSALESDKPVWEVPLVVSGSGDESDLTPLSREQFDADAASANLRWIGPAEEISLAGTAIRGQTMWWWLALLVLLLLLVEMTVLAWPSFRPQDASSSPLSPGGRGVGGEGEAALT